MSEKQNKEEKIVKLKLDIIFKRIFGNENNKSIISKFISDLLEIPHNKIRKIYIKNVELTPKYLEKKFSRLDLNELYPKKWTKLAEGILYKYTYC